MFWPLYDMSYGYKSLPNKFLKFPKKKLHFGCVQTILKFHTTCQNFKIAFGFISIQIKPNTEIEIYNHDQNDVISQERAKIIVSQITNSEWNFF